MKRKLLICTIIIALIIVTGCSRTATKQTQEKTKATIESLSDLSGKRISILSASCFAQMIEDETKIKDPVVMEYNSSPDAIIAVVNNKADAAVVDLPVGELYCSSYPQLTILEESLSDDCYGFAFAKGSSLCSEFSSVIRKMDADGTIESLKKKWCGKDYEAKTIPEQTWPGLNGTLSVWCNATAEPMCYVGNEGQIVGLDIDVLLAIAKELDYHMEFTECDSNGRIAGIVSGKADVSCGSMSITEERKQSVDFSDTYYVGAAVFLIRKADTKEKTSFTKLSDLSGKTIASVDGSLFKEYIDENGKIDYSKYEYHATQADGIAALTSGKIDALICDLPIATCMVNANSGIKILEEILDTDNYGFALKKGSPLTSSFNEVIAQMRADGTMTELQEKWFGTDESIKKPVNQDWAAPNGEINYWIADEGYPMCYVNGNNESLGLELDIMLEIAKRLGYKVNYKSVAFGSLIAAVTAGKTDVASGIMTISDERKKSVDMTDSYYDGAIVAIVRETEISSSNAQTGTSSQNTGFITSIKASFTKTFITEGRWKLFLSGLGNTMLITIAAALFGTILGFGFFMMCRKGNRIANSVVNALSWLIQGMPTVVLLMVLYYIVFGKSDISGTIIAILGFTITFGNSMYGMIKVGVGALDKGQEEAALALGYSSSHSFFRIILPQAAQIFLPSYKAELVSLAKATSIVGYIAVQDLTKMSDIVRSRTYEAFFPLIVTAIIYYLFGALLTYLINRIQINIDPEHRKEESILKGVTA